MIKAIYGGHDGFELSVNDGDKTYTASGRFDDNGQGYIVAAPSGKDQKAVQDELNKIGQFDLQKIIFDAKNNSAAMH